MIEDVIYNRGDVSVLRDEYEALKTDKESLREVVRY
jgi:hypothetical protein